MKIKDIISTPLIVIDPDADLVEAASLMKEHKIRRLAVVRADTLLGVITAGDIMRNLSNYVEKEVQDVLRYLWVPKYYPDVMRISISLDYSSETNYK
jgi:DNA phosphorothioation-dependent restriction protein DptG